MKILLYKPGEETSFRLFTEPCDVMVDNETNQVNVLRNGFIVESFKLLKKHAPVWTDETKPYSELMVKLDVVPIEVKVEQ